jgi:predicted nuclease of predicted toxin-antitoxin system
MKLLFDHNLSPRLVVLLRDLFPESQHVFGVGMDQDDDRKIWDYATQSQLLIVTRDSDYNDLSMLLGFPPKVIWIRRGNCSTQAIETLLRNSAPIIQEFDKTDKIGLLTLY